MSIEEKKDPVFMRRSRMLEQLFADPRYVPLKLKELAILLDVPREERDALKEVLDALLAEGKISLSSRGKYAAASVFARTGLFNGTRRGFGFVTPEEGGDDIFIPEEETGGAFHGDTVRYLVVGQGEGGRRAWGRVVQVVKRGVTEVIGTYERNKKNGFVIPDNQKLSFDVFVPAGQSMGAVDGHKVVVRLKNYGDRGRNPEGTVTQILGHRNDPGVDIQSIVMAYGLPQEFPETVMQQVSWIPDHVTEEEKEGRLDLRNISCVTIDGADAKDLDDAVSLTKEDGIYYLGVHIADVSHYVTEGSPLDSEALKRGTSVYLVDRVIPMLPHALSNGICSLNEGEDRLALSCLMELDEKGSLLSYRIAETLIRVDKRMNYSDVNRILEQEEDGQIPAGYEPFVPMLRMMDGLAGLLRERRYGRGAIDFDFPESKIILDESGRPMEIKPYERNSATWLIEDFMLITNETIAEDFYWQELPFVYRSHEKPDPEKIRRLTLFLNNFGYYLKGKNDEVRPKELQKLLDRIAGTPEEALISRMMLRSLKQARYTTECQGHFGLAAKYYCHFTSPIRRYPDLQIHRIIKENLHGQLGEKRIGHYTHILPQVAMQSSVTERRADEAERETDKVKKAQYMKRFLGEEFTGVISGVANWGMYVELPNTVEGCVRISDLHDDYYAWDEARMELRGERSGRVHRLGQKIRVQVAQVDTLLHTVDFVPCMGEEEE